MITERTKKILIRVAILLIAAVIIGIYYLSELKPFPYESYDKDITQLQRYDAELNEATVLIRFGLLRNYDPIIQAGNGMREMLANFHKILKDFPNPDLQEKVDSLETAVEEKEDLIQKFERINPILLNAINSFSKILYEIIESESHMQSVERSLENIEGQLNLTEHTDRLADANKLFRGILIYVSQRSEEKHNDLVKLVADIRKEPQKLPKMDLVLVYADKILEYQPQLSLIDEALFQVPIIPRLNDLRETYNEVLREFIAVGDAFRIILYLLVLILLGVLRWTYSRLENTVTTLHIEVQRKIKAERELAETNRQLENRVAQRTQELTIKNRDLNQALGDLKEAQDQLIIQEKMASVGMLSTGIAHEIKNPLNFVNNFSDLSIELVTELDEELKSNKEKLGGDTVSYISEILADLKTNCSKIKEHGVRADNIVKNMLMHSQEAGVQKEMVDLKMLMDDNIQIALEAFRAAHGKFDIKLDKVYDPSLEKVPAAPQSIARVFIYIIDNSLYALKERQLHSPPDYEPTLNVSMDKQNQNVIIKIRDNGTGIPKKDLDKVFEPFFTTKPTGRGNTGLGLSICYDTVVKQHKGELRVTSQEGIFTEFTIILPLNPKESPG